MQESDVMRSYFSEYLKTVENHRIRLTEKTDYFW